jgi:hypothetical protein
MTRACTRLLLGAVMVVTGLAMGVPSPTPLRAQAQTPDPLPRFEVALVKQSTSGRTQTLVQPSGGFVATDAPLKMLIADAFIGAPPLALSRVLGGPG